MNTALQNIRVLDLSRVLAGPWASQLLGDYGADVVKVERRGAGDDTRQWGPPWLDGQDGGESAYFLSANRNKRSVCVDMATPGGQQVIRDLASQADILIENFKVGSLERFGLGIASLRELNPRLVACSISAFGRSGSRAREPGYDAMIQGSAGLMSITGESDENGGGPQKVGVAIADIMAGMYAVTAILAALHARDVNGEGQHIDVPLYDSQVAWLANQNMNFLVGGVAPGRLGTGHPNLVPYQAFTTQDGNLMLAIGNDRQFRSCMQSLGLESLGTDERFARNAERVKHRETLVEIMEEAFRRRPTSYWLKDLTERGIPAGPINDIEEVLTNTHARERQLVRHLRNGAGADVPLVANPVDFSATPVRYAKAPPLLGEHTDEVLQEWLGYSADVISDLRETAAI